jgi:hypothetical protein
MSAPQYNNGQPLVVAQITPSTRPNLIELRTPGPQGPPGVTSLNGLSDVNVSGKADKSVLYFDSAQGVWLGNDINTISSITDGGNW